jgi:hypothetical protein
MVIILLIILAIFLSSTKNHQDYYNQNLKKSTTSVHTDTTHFGKEILIELNEDILHKWIQKKRYQENSLPL